MEINKETQWSELIAYINTYIQQPRRDKLLTLYNVYADRMKSMPASTKSMFHSAFDGGYVHHVLNVIKAALKFAGIWRELGVNVNYSDEEIVFAALNHDLGKVGNEDHPYYIPNPSDWHVKHQGAIYTICPDLPFMAIHDRSLFILQRYGIEVSYNETLAIRLHGGLYDDGTKDYLTGYVKLNTSLPFILHQADLTAARIEFEQQYMYANVVTPEKKKFSKKDAKVQIIASNPEADVLKNFLKNL